MDSVRFITEDESLAKDMYADFGCILAHREIGAPGVKSEFINIPFRSGSINAYSLVTDRPVYDNRTIKMDFLYLNGGDQNLLISQIYEFIHGRELWVEFSDDAGYWYRSFVASISKVSQTHKAVKITITCECSPFKYDRISTLAEWEWDGLDLVNGIINDLGELEIEGRKMATFRLVCHKAKAYPRFISDQRLSIFINTSSTPFIVDAGDFKLYEAELLAGENVFRILNYNNDETAHVKIEYRGESL